MTDDASVVKADMTDASVVKTDIGVVVKIRLTNALEVKSEIEADAAVNMTDNGPVFEAKIGVLDGASLDEGDLGVGFVITMANDATMVEAGVGSSAVLNITDVIPVGEVDVNVIDNL